MCAQIPGSIFYQILWCFFFFNCAGWGYIVAFTKVLTMYQLCHTWIHPTPDSWNRFNRYHFFIYIRVYTLFSLYSASDPLPILLQPAGKTCSALLFTDFVGEKTSKIIKTWFLLVWDKDSYLGRFFVLVPSIYVLPPTLVHLYQTSSLLPSLHTGLCQFKVTIQWAHQPLSSFWFSSFSLSRPYAGLPLESDSCAIILLHLF
jgi:hypothetical protein